MKKGKEKVVYRPIRCSTELDETVGRLAAEKRTSKSEVLRDLVDKGLIATGAKTDDEFLSRMVKQAVQTAMKPQVERLAAISAKATQISGAAFFMGIYAASCKCPPSEQQEISEAATSARELGIQYLKLKNRDIDTFIHEGVKRVIDESE